VSLVSRVAASADPSSVDAKRLAEYLVWLSAANDRFYTRSTRVPLGALAEWEARPGTAIMRHRTGRFFSVEGLDARIEGDRQWRWQQPVLVQPDVGVLGLLVAERDGLLQALVQAKPEPGNCNGLQVAPTVQATHSNYTRAHGGGPVPFLELFLDADAQDVLADTRQSEHGAYFLRKRNRNIVVIADPSLDAPDEFTWLTLAEVFRLLAIDDLVSMDLRTVLSCLPHRPFTEPKPAEDSFRAALLRSAQRSAPARHSTAELLHWITATRSRYLVRVDKLTLPELDEWRHEDVLARESGSPFAVVGVEVEAAGREVRAWTQPMVEAPGTGLFALVTAQLNGVLHLLMQLRFEPGLVDVVELAPSVEIRPSEPERLADQHDLHDLVVSAPRQQVRFDTTLSEEGGRFYHLRNRHVVVETPPVPEPRFHRWMTLDQITDLLQHAFYVNSQARSLICCLRSLMGIDEPMPGPAT
jgi:dTDP-4-dehydro-6-deoxy-alpha-D-glucopyranose 2,3-dehydratase